jgi:hypothetical protein
MANTRHVEGAIMHKIYIPLFNIVPISCNIFLIQHMLVSMYVIRSSFTSKVYTTAAEMQVNLEAHNSH